MTRTTHTSLYGAADRIVKKIEESDLVRKVALGRSTGKSHGQRDGAIKIQGDVPAGIKILIYGSKGITEAVVYCKDKDRDAVRELIGWML